MTTLSLMVGFLGGGYDIYVKSWFCVCVRVCVISTSAAEITFYIHRKCAPLKKV